MVKALLLGGGYTLQRVARRLGPESCIITSRSEEKLSQFQSQGISAVKLDNKDAAALNSFLSENPEIDTVVDSVPPLFEDKGGKDYSAEEVLAGVKNLCAAAASSNIRRILYLSTTGVFGVSDGSVVEETSECNPVTPQSRARLGSEVMYQESGIPSTSLRISGIYGPGRGLGIMLAKQRYRIVGDGTRWTNRIHVDDLVEVICRALLTGHDMKLPEVLCVTDDKPTQIRQVLDFYLDKFDLPAPPSVTVEQALAQGRSRLALNQRVSNRRIKELFDFELHYPSYQEGAGTEFEEDRFAL